MFAKRICSALMGLMLSLFAAQALAVVEVEDSRGTQRFERVPQRVVALNWAVTEELLALGVTPVGVADIRGYNDWVVKPAIPEPVVDVGRRDEPSLEVMASLKPDLILIGSQQGGLIDKLAPIAPVLYFDNYRADHDNLAAIDRSFQTLARVLGREAEAEAILDRRQQRMDELAEQLRAHFGTSLPKVTVVRLGDTAHTLVYGANSSVAAAMQGLGLEQAMPQPSTQWGMTHKKVTDLAAVGEGMLLYIEPFPKRDQLFSMPLWQFMPFVQNDRIAAVEPVWSYGGAASIELMAEALTRSLLEIAP